MLQEIQTLPFWTGAVCWLLILMPAGLIWWSRRFLTKLSFLLRSRNAVSKLDSNHEVDRSFDQPFGLIQIFVASLVIALVAYTALFGVTWGFSRWYFRHNVKLTQTFAERVLDLTGRSALERFKNDFQPGGRPSEPFQRFLTLLTDDRDIAAASTNVLEQVKAFMEAEQSANALSGYAGLLIGDTSSAEGRALRDAVLDHALNNLVPYSLQPVAFEPYFDSLGTQEMESLKQLQFRLGQVYQQSPQIRKLTEAVYRRLSEKEKQFSRIRALFFGDIQFYTVVLFYLGVFLLAGRRENLQRQKWLISDQPSPFGSSPDHKYLGFKSFVTAETTRQQAGSALYKALMARPNDSKDELLKSQRITGAPSNNVLPTTPAEEICRDELTVTKEFAEWVNRHDTPQRKHYYGIAARQQVLTELIANLDIGAPLAEARSRARQLLTEISARTESRLDRVEYTYVDYVIYAMPSLGFIGTVVGIGQALTSAHAIVRATDVNSQAIAISSVTSVLGFAFDTTLVALVTTIFLMWMTSRLRSRESEFLLEIQQKLTDDCLS